jgi:hypothetical protein
MDGLDSWNENRHFFQTASGFHPDPHRTGVWVSTGVTTVEVRMLETSPLDLPIRLCAALCLSMSTALPLPLLGDKAYYNTHLANEYAFFVRQCRCAHFHLATDIR